MGAHTRGTLEMTSLTAREGSPAETEQSRWVHGMLANSNKTDILNYMLEFDRPNSQKIQYNSMLIKGYQSFQNKDIQAALFHYQDALKMST